MSSSLAADARSIVDAAIDAALPSNVMPALDIGDVAGRIVILGAGKAAMAMAGAFEHRLPEDVRGRIEGFVIVPEGYPETLPDSEFPPSRIVVRTAAHPIPDHLSAAAGQAALDLADSLSAEDLLIVLLSGGASSLWAVPEEGITQEELRETFDMLVHSGLPIQEINAVRRRLSKIAGGGLARAAAPSRVMTLVIADVLGDSLHDIGSGPTVDNPDPLHAPKSLLQHHGLWEALPESVKGILSNPPEKEAIAEQDIRVLATNKTALDAASARAKELGYETYRNEAPLAGDARMAGRRMARAILHMPGPQICLLMGGETVVKVENGGKGGRNQELAIAGGLLLEETPHDRPMLVLGLGTDGIDGNTNATGAWVDDFTIPNARQVGISPEEILDANDSYSLHDATGTHIITGPTHTNVMDLAIALVKMDNNG